MKKVIFSDLEPTRFLEALRLARSGKTPSWIMQEQVKQSPLRVVVFGEGSKEEVREYFFRVTAFITAEGLLGAVVTGRPDKEIHGAKDCIMIPCIFP